MELWIRSQSKIDFMCVKRVQYGHANNRHIIYGKDLSMFLGEYDTKERCLEIIDEIQKLLYCDFVIANSNTNIKDLEDIIKQKGSILHFPEEPLVEYHSASTVVYEMPKN